MLTRTVTIRRRPQVLYELPRNRPAVRRKWIKFIQFKRADFLAAPHHAHLCSEHFSECDFANPMEYCMGFASKLTRCSVLIQNPAWQAQTDTAVSLWVYRAKYQSVSSSELELAILQRLPKRSRHMVTWFGSHGDAFGTTENAFFRAFITLRSQIFFTHIIVLSKL